MTIIIITPIMRGLQRTLPMKTTMDQMSGQSCVI